MQQLLNPFAQKYPDTVESTLSSQASSVRFNPNGPYAGQYLAAGGADGLVEVWDVETRGVVRVLEGHVKAVGGVWNNRFLLTASLDSTAIIWDLSYLTPLLPSSTSSASTLNTIKASSQAIGSSSARLQTIRFDAPVANAQFHPRNSRIVLATLTCNEVVLLDLRQGGGRWVLEDVGEDEVRGGEEGMDVDVDGAEGRERKRSTLTCAVFSPCGSRIYAGTTQGSLLIFDPLTRLVIHRAKIANSSIRQLAFDSSGRNIIASSSDRALRTLQVSPLTGLLTPIHRFQDLVNRTPWHAIGFSGDGEYVMGGAGHKVAHNVFVWDRESGTLVKVMEGPKESLIDCDWHPTKPAIASVAVSGDIHIWQTSYPDNWAAFAPGFEELEENVEYDEREDEFDIEDETELTRRKDLEEDIRIDVLSPSTDYPRPPEPSTHTGAPTSGSGGTGIGVGTGNEEAELIQRSMEAMKTVRDWADGDEMDGDGDEDERFWLSIDLLEEIGEGEEEGK